jgi:hypothetical protein
LLGSALVTSTTYPAPRPGDVLAGKYILKERIGAGGMGTVFAAEHPGTTRRVAIKVLHPHLAADLVIARRFREEALAASRVHHRGSVAILDHGTPADGVPFIAMELVRGRPLSMLLEEEDLPLPRALRIFDQILDALDAAHTCGVVHGDIKSDNIMVDARVDGDGVTLVDFGLAQLDSAVREPGFVAGTPEYLAPELVLGEAPTAASDQYAAGVLLYELLTGAPPFALGSSSAILRRHLSEAVVPPSRRRPDRGIPAAIDRIALRALAKDPADRFASVRELRGALAAIRLAAAQARRRRKRAIAPRLARGSAAGRDELRRTIAAARARGDQLAVACGYAVLAAALLDELQHGASREAIAAACAELALGLAALAALAADDAPVVGAEIAEPAHRLAVSLAALYELAGEPDKARRAIACVDGRDTLVDLAP